MATEWVDRLNDASQRYVASQLYAGRVVTEVFRASEAAKAEFSFVSAGLGLVSSRDRIPAYNLTVARGAPDSVQDRIAGDFRPAAWWRSLGRALGSEHALRSAVRGVDGGLVLLALPSSYLAMIDEDLQGLSAPLRSQLRIFGPRRESDVPSSLRAAWMPYDARLDNARSGYNGTASDFPQRALHHFCATVLPDRPSASSEGHRALVDKALSRFRPYVRPRGTDATDEQVLTAIQRMWKPQGGRRTAMLRELRDVNGVACEQKRFQRLASEFEESLRGKK